MENKLPVVDKYLSDGGNPNAADNVSATRPSLKLLTDAHKVSVRLVLIVFCCRPVPENSSAQSLLQRTRGGHEETPGGRSDHREERQGDSFSFFLCLSFPNTHPVHESNSLVCVCVCSSWRPRPSTGPAEEAACRPYSSSSTREPNSPPETRLVHILGSLQVTSAPRGKHKRVHSSGATLWCSQG